MTGVLLWVGIFVGLMLLSHQAVRKVLREGNLSVAFACGHLLFVGAVAISVQAGLRREEAMADLLWIVPMILDFPMTLLYFSMKPQFTFAWGGPVLGPRLWSPAIFCGVLGTLQWGLIGLGIEEWRRRGTSARA